VNKASTTALITADTPDPSVVGQAVPVHYNVSVAAPGSGTPTGNVQVTDGVNNCTGTAAAGQCNLTLTTAGARSLTATYQGDPNFSASPASTGEAHQVNPADTTTAVTLTTGINPSVFGQSLTFTASVSAVAPASGTPAGNLNFFDGGTCSAPGTSIVSNVALNGSGQATASSSTLSVSSSPHSILACYLGNSNYNASTGSIPQTVNKADTTAAITSDSPDPSTTTQQITVKYTVSVTAPGGGTPTANVQVSDGTDSCTGTVAAGQCNVILTSAGTRTLKATYQGDSNYNASPASASATHTVLTPATLDVQSPITANQQGVPADFDAQSVTPPTMVVNHTGTATATCGAGAGASQIMSGQTHTYTYTCSSVSGDGSLTFTASGSTVSGTDATSSQGITGAGTATSNSVTVDDTQPDVSITPPSGNVSVPFTFNWSVTDPTAGGVSSGVNASSCTLKIDAAAPIAVPCTSSNSSLVSGTHTVVVAGADIASNINSATRTYTLDNTPPLVTVTFPPIVHGQNGWYNGQDTVPVVGMVTANDSTTGGSNVTAIMCTGATVGTITGFNTVSASAPVSVSAEGVNNISCTATDSAGNNGAGGASSNTATIKIDTLAPTGILGAANRGADNNGWYNHAVDVVFTGTDSLSGIDSCSTVTYSSPDTTNTSVNGTCTDKAGNTSVPASSSFKFDSTPPTAALAVTAGTPGANGWYTSNVTVSTSGTDTVSNPTVCTADQFQTTETMGGLFHGSCTNDAGLTTNATALNVKLDKTGPTADLHVKTGTLGENSWYVTNVVIETTGADLISSPVTCTADETLMTDTTGTVFHGSCTNDAGLSTNASDLNVKRDATPPVVVITPDRSADHNAWYNHALTFTNPGTDATSGIASCTTPGAYNAPDSMIVSVSATCKDNAGNVGNGSFDFKFDATAPTIVAGAPNREPDHNTWYNHAVDIVFTGTDATSGIDTCSTISYSGPDAVAASVMGHCTDKAGNTSSPDSTSPTFKFDLTPPTAILAVTAGMLGSNSWYTSNVTVGTSGTDTVSNPTTCTVDQFQTAETTGTPFSGQCTNDAGLSANATPLMIKLDKTAPTGVVLTPSGTPGLHNWYISDVTIHATGTETISNPISCSLDQLQTTDTTGQPFHGSCTNDAGLSANATEITIKRDATPPVLTLAFSPGSPDGNNDWWRTPGGVPFAWTCIDPTSDVDASYNGGCPTPMNGTVVANGTTNFNLQVRDQAGNLSVVVDRSLKLDNVAPTITFLSRTPANANGWNKTDVSLSWSCSDVTSHAVSDGDTKTVTTEGLNQSSTGNCQDVAGNTSSNTQNGVNIDKTPPTVTPGTPPAGSPYLLNQVVTPAFTCTDTLSGFVSSGAISTTGRNTTDCTGPATVNTSTIGPHSYGPLVATDKAGNVSVPVTTNYNINYSFVGFLQPIDNLPVVNTANAGRTIPVKWQLKDANGVLVSDLTSLTSLLAAPMVCSAAPAAIVEEQLSSPGSTVFRFDGTQFIFNWQTAKSWSGCWLLQTTLNDGTVHYAKFQFK
jgi:Bacterial Ig-like domain (group 3)